MLKNPIRYRSNGDLLGLPNNGRKVYDQVTGLVCYERFLAQDDYGDLVDSRGDGFDVSQGDPAVHGQLGSTQ